MGIGRYFMHDFFTAMEFDRMEETVERHEATQSSSITRIQELERDVGTLALLTRALVELSIERGQFDQAAVRARVADIDARDGRLDGRFDEEKVGAKLCEACGHRLHPNKERCMYCGH